MNTRFGYFRIIKWLHVKIFPIHTFLSVETRFTCSEAYKKRRKIGLKGKSRNSSCCPYIHPFNILGGRDHEMGYSVELAMVSKRTALQNIPKESVLVQSSRHIEYLSSFLLFVSSPYSSWSHWAKVDKFHFRESVLPRNCFYVLSSIFKFFIGWANF